MTFEDINEHILKTCINSKMCERGKEIWRANNLSDLLAMYKNEPEFLLKNKPFPLSYIKETFGEELLQSKSVYILNEGVDVVMRDKSLDGVFSACNGKLSLESQDSIIYISDKSNLDIYVNKMGVYSLHIYDNSIVNIHCNVEAKIFIFSIKENQIRYSGEYKGIKLIKK